MKKELEKKEDFIEDNEFVSDREEKEQQDKLSMAHGGMACSTCGSMPGEECTSPGCENEMGICEHSEGFLSPIVGFDEVSGNEIPAGSNAQNVRDDIPAALSDGEYVVPADVVRYHGLKTFMALRDEAKFGLMSMQFEGQIANIEDEHEDTVPCPECDGSGCEHCDFKGYHDAEEGSHETPEGNVIEKPIVETKEEKMDAKKSEDQYPSAKYSYRQKVKFAAIK